MSYGPPPSDSDEDDYDGFMFSTDYDSVSIFLTYLVTIK